MIHDYYYTFDLPIPYKKLLIHPVKIRDYHEFIYYSSCLTLEKNSIKDPALAIKAITMTYFQYMMEVSNQENNMIALFDALLRLVLNKKDETCEIQYGRLKDGKPFFEIDGEVYDTKDFDEIRKIICDQNLLDLPDESIQKDVRDKMEEARKFKQKINGSKIASFEEQLLALSLYSGIELEKIHQMSFRKFMMAIKRANHMIMSNIYLTASMSGFVTFKDKSVLKGWLADISDYDKNKDVLMSIESVQNKINMEDAKNKK